MAEIPEPPNGTAFVGDHPRFKAWVRIDGFRGLPEDDPSHWVPTGDRVAYPYETALGCGMQPLVPLLTAGELIPDPDDQDALETLVYEAQRYRDVGKVGATAVIRSALQALRARGESRVPTGGTDQNGEGE